jgi:hypothetical protein
MTTTEPVPEGSPIADELLPDGAGQRRFTTALLVIVLVGLVLRLAYVWFVWRDRELLGDPVFYHEAANLLADGKGFINPFAYRDGLSMESADHPPLYTLFLGLVSTMGVRSVVGHMVASCLLGAAAIYVSGLLGKEVASRRVGLIAAALVAIYPNTWRYDGMVLSESMVILVVSATLLAAYRYWRAPSMWRLAATGAGVALCALARSELLLLSVFLVLPLVVLTKARPWRDRLRWLGAAALTCTLVLTPWVVFNLSRFDRPVLLSGQMEVTLTVANCPGAYYGTLVGYWDYSCGGRILDARGVSTSTGDGTAERVLLEETLDYMRSEAGRIPAVVGVRVARLFNLWSPVNAVDIDSVVERHPRSVAWASLVSFWVVGATAAAGAVVLRRRRALVFPLLTPLAVVAATTVLFYASTRFRAAAEGALCVLAAVAVDAAWRRWGPAGGRSVGVAPVTPEAVAHAGGAEPG